jgi:NADH dehydrogenase
VTRPRVIIVGGGFAGLSAAKALAKAPCDVRLVDRRNHHVFQPLLYQVATASLSPADISAPIRSVLGRQANCEVALAEAIGVDVEKRHLLLPGGHVEYDYLVLCAGATHAYFGHEEWAPIAPGLKTIEDATQLRRRILLAFESAEYEGSEEARRAVLTFGIVGGGPTGVELAGAIKEIAGQTIPRDYKHIDTRTTRVILFEGGDRVIGTFPPESSARAKRELERMGVEVRVNSVVTQVTPHGVQVGAEFIPVRNVFWAAGVKASPLGRSLGVPLDRAGRVIVGPDLSIPGHPEVMVCGDLAAAKSANTGEPVPGVAQGGIQMGHYAGTTIAREVSGKATPATRKPFSYVDKGTMAVIGKARAVAVIGGYQFGGFLAWLLWGGIHITYLIGFRNRVQVMLSWFWNWLLNARDARLITGDAQMDLRTPRTEEFVADERRKGDLAFKSDLLVPAAVRRSGRLYWRWRACRAMLPAIAPDVRPRGEPPCGVRDRRHWSFHCLEPGATTEACGGQSRAVDRCRRSACLRGSADSNSG